LLILGNIAAESINLRFNTNVKSVKKRDLSEIKLGHTFF